MKNYFITLLLSFSCLAKEVAVAWKPVPGASAYFVSYGTVNLTQNRTVTSTNIVLDLVDNRNYFVTVKALNDKNESLPSKALFFNLTTKPKTNSLETPRPFVIRPDRYGHAESF